MLSMKSSKKRVNSKIRSISLLGQEMKVEDNTFQRKRWLEKGQLQPKSLQRRWLHLLKLKSLWRIVKALKTSIAVLVIGAIPTDHKVPQYEELLVPQKTLSNTKDQHHISDSNKIIWKCPISHLRHSTDPKLQKSLDHKNLSRSRKVLSSKRYRKLWGIVTELRLRSRFRIRLCLIIATSTTKPSQLKKLAK